jgi:PIN domain nuclease of toxin-antitoxin system
VGHRMTTVLLDTHILLWWLQGGSQLSAKAKAILQDPGVRVLVSAASAWEIAIKHRAGKLDAATALVARFESAIEAESFAELAISVRHTVEAGLLKGSHRDPFDRLLIAQARLEGVAVVSTDKCFDAYGVPRLW